jgi:hypothetical protein
LDTTEYLLFSSQQPAADAVREERARIPIFSACSLSFEVRIPEFTKEAENHQWSISSRLFYLSAHGYIAAKILAIISGEGIESWRSTSADWAPPAPAQRCIITGTRY